MHACRESGDIAFCRMLRAKRQIYQHMLSYKVNILWIVLGGDMRWADTWNDPASFCSQFQYNDHNDGRIIVSPPDRCWRANECRIPRYLFRLWEQWICERCGKNATMGSIGWKRMTLYGWEASRNQNLCSVEVLTWPPSHTATLKSAGRTQPYGQQTVNRASRSLYDVWDRLCGK